ncbi:CobW family GTP-binding protein [Stutzerimonas stutzeri]|uniref:Cobalamin biosynthesis protein CobW n=1 Tax=Stutzerimonas stutzeri KOS6 TaxID=1218352 RepID=A0A061JV25_STUST|nr:CobW family GTP-binding protein [Stutzerimonas stutzeri]EWC42300.1 cobalamin biosynthesis protein CobW [Stutzerimonas stutzeri KOS6]
MRTIGAMLERIPTHLIGGPLGAGKTSLIRHLLTQKPTNERWAVLVNEFGQIGLDAALLSSANADVTLAEIPGGCLCCVNGVPFQVGLARLLRRARPDRLLIEPSGLGHPAELLHQLGQPPWQRVLAVQPSVLVLDARALSEGMPLPDSQQQALGDAGLLLLNKSEALDEPTRRQLANRLPDVPLYWASHGQLPLDRLPGIHARASEQQAGTTSLPPAPAALPQVWLDPGQPICQIQAAPEGWSIGWRWHPTQHFDLERLRHWLVQWPWRRAKLVVHGRDGWQSANALDGQPLRFSPSEWRKDSRLELIFAEPQAQQELEHGMRSCRIVD